jgi:hypothetical protein
MSASPLAASTGPLAAPFETDALDADEVLLWTVMRTFEVQASAQYQLHAPRFASLKAGVGPALRRIARDDRPLDESILAPTMKALVESASAVRDERTVLVIQGLVLERVRRVVYTALMELADVPASSKSIARMLEPVSAEIVAHTPALLASACAASGHKPFALFVEASDDVLHKLDAVGEGVDEVFTDCFGLRFADIVGDFVADLVPICVELGMERRKVMSHLAGALMGI